MTQQSSNQNFDDSTERFARLLGVHEHQISAYVLSLVPRWNDARDVVQEVRVRLWQQIDQYDASKDFGAWARAIAYYEVLSYRTRNGRAKVIFSDDVVQAVADEAAMQALATDNRQSALAECLDGLDESQRKMLLRCYEPGSSTRLVAQEQSRSYASFRKAIYRLRQLLHECIKNRLATEGSR